MSGNGQGTEEEGEGQVLGARDVPFLVGGVKGVPAGHGGIKGNRLALVSVLKGKGTNSMLSSVHHMKSKFRAYNSDNFIKGDRFVTELGLCCSKKLNF